MLEQFELVANEFSGIEILSRIRKGHVVRRECWIDGIFLRICNEKGYDVDGNVILDDRETSLYMISTTGYFQHLGFSSQKFREPRVFEGGGYTCIVTRDGEGMSCWFAHDWEDYGFCSSKDFSAYTEANKEELREYIEAIQKQAIEQAKLTS